MLVVKKKVWKFAKPNIFIFCRFFLLILTGFYPDFAHLFCFSPPKLFPVFLCFTIFQFSFIGPSVSPCVGSISRNLSMVKFTPLKNSFMHGDCSEIFFKADGRKENKNELNLFFLLCATLNTTNISISRYVNCYSTFFNNIFQRFVLFSHSYFFYFCKCIPVKK